jgi:hypothetical protein
MRKTCRSKAQLAFGNRGYGELCHGNFHQPAIDSRAIPFDNAARDMGVEQVACHFDETKPSDKSEQVAFLRNFILTIGHELIGDIGFPPEFEETVP